MGRLGATLNGRRNPDIENEIAPLRSENARLAELDANWIVELVSTGLRGGKPFRQVHNFLTALRTSPKALLPSNAFRSIRAGLMAVAHDISRRLGWSVSAQQKRGELAFCQS